MRFLNLFKLIIIALVAACAQPAFATVLSEKKAVEASRDTAITTAIQEKLAANKFVSDLKILVSSKSGIVTLGGKVNTDEEARKIIEIAESTPGVKDTDTSHLVIEESKQPIMDTFIIAKVNGAFAREKLFGDKDITVMSINVDSKNGVVYLTGTAATKEEAKNAVKIAKSIKGVKRVDSKIEVKPST